MLKVIGFVATCGVVAALAAGVVVNKQGPSTQALEVDLLTVRAEIADAERAREGIGGLVAIQAELRLHTLRSTEAMLNQKRLSFLRGIRLNYPGDLPSAVVAPEERDQIEVELAAARAEAEAAQHEAARYSGGLILVLAKVREATALSTAAMLHQQLALARQGIPLRVGGGGNPSSAAARLASPGTAVSDKEALQ